MYSMYRSAIRSELSAAAARDISRGEQLLHSYGNLSDAETLETYGFVEDLPDGHRNPHNNVTVPLDLVIRTSEAAQASMQVRCCRLPHLRTDPDFVQQVQIGDDRVERLLRSWPERCSDAPEQFSVSA